MEDSPDHIQDQERAAALIAKHIQGELSDTEKKELDAWAEQAEWRQAYLEQGRSPAYLDHLMTEYHKAAELEAGIRAAISLKMGQAQETPPVPPARSIHFLRSSWFRVAALLILLLGTGLYIFHRRPVSDPGMAMQQPASRPIPIPPGHQGAILTLADGKQLNLDSLPNGVVADQNGTKASVTDGKLAYHPNISATKATLYNTISTPKGRQYQLILPDGTKVWLNAASRITFPTVFAEAERKITISGEAYFEAARDAGKPFKISAGGTEVEVLGTSFNISAYRDAGNVATTLLDGSVKVSGQDTKDSKPHEPVILKPGQQAIVNDQVRVDSKVNIEQVIAWKNGLFYFSGTDIVTVMQQLSRWYDIDVRYEGKVPDIKMYGKMDKGLNLDEILEFLTKMEVKYKLVGRTVIVTNN